MSIVDGVSGEQPRERRGASFTGLLTLTIFAVGVLLIAADLADGQSWIRDVDDGLRELQIRQFLFGGAGWFDLGMPQIRTPELYVSPWSRLVDLPYVVLFGILAPLVGEEHALPMAFRIWPLVMLVAQAWLIALFIRPHFTGAHWSGLRILLVSAITAAVMMVALSEFSPGRIDHHNLQILAATAIAVGLQTFDERGAFFIGLASAVSLLVGLECLPLIMVAYGGLAFAWLFNAPDSGRVLSVAGGALAFFSLLLGLLFISPAGLVAVACDSFSAPYAYLAVASGTVLSVVPVWFKHQSNQARWAALLLPSVALVAMVIVLFPDCLNGPYSMVDDVARQFWLQRIPQEHGLFFHLQTGDTRLFPVILLSAVVAIWTLPALASRFRAEPGLLIAFGFALTALVLTLLQMRYIRLSAALMPLFLPMAIGWALGSPVPTMLRRAVSATALLIASLGIAFLVTPRAHVETDAASTMGNACDGADFSVVRSLAPGRILAPQGLGVPLLLGGEGRHAVNAIPFHRAAAGMSLGFKAFLSTDAADRRHAMRGFNYVAVCKLPPDMTLNNGGLYAALATGGIWPGLEPIDAGAGNPLKLFRIDPRVLH
ncbi:hypothetical protein [Rhizobium sp. AAP43]|uniref:hypothetical protein n=1 Tax=Rhizobium sp. AAP43 TaxID=1523420 RepID=UPI0006CC5575|nr:hypothetical protein [Rhizobium sp. AAP43]KPF42465.1 hypothetical protein IP76_17545 [Rhizobium sp. AAP43]